MRETNVLGLKVVGITATVLAVLFGLYWGGKVLLTDKDKAGDQTNSTGLTSYERSRDSDSDGVADLYETTFYNTDPQNADTDNDGQTDLQEIVSGSDPLVPGPADEAQVITGSAITKTDTYTQKYLASLPDNIAKEEILDQVNLEAFVNSNKGVLLPEVSVTSTAVEGKEAVTSYLDTVSSAHNDKLSAVTSTDIEAAFRLQVNTQNKQTMTELVSLLKNNVAILESVNPPSEVSALHTKLLAASKALTTNSELLLDIDNDFVGGLIGAKNIEELGAVFQELAEEIKALETKYDIQ